MKAAVSLLEVFWLRVQTGHPGKPQGSLGPRKPLPCCAPGWARPLSLLQRGLAPRSKGKARAELRPARRQARLPHSRSLLLYGLWPTRLLCPWDSPGKNTGVDCRALLQGIFPTQELNLYLWLLIAVASLHCKARTLGRHPVPRVRGSPVARPPVPGVRLWASLVAQMVKNLPAMQEPWVQSLAWEGTLEEGMATHCSVLAWRTPWTEEPGGLQSTLSQRVRHD